MEDKKGLEQRAQRMKRNAAILELLKRLGLTADKTETLSGQVNPMLLKLARQKSGALSNNQLLELALGNLVADDGFPLAFMRSRGSVAPDIDLEL